MENLDISRTKKLCGRVQNEYKGREAAEGYYVPKHRNQKEAMVIQAFKHFGMIDENFELEKINMTKAEGEILRLFPCQNFNSKACFAPKNQVIRKNIEKCVSVKITHMIWVVWNDWYGLWVMEWGWAYQPTLGDRLYPYWQPYALSMENSLINEGISGIMVHRRIGA